MELTENPDNLNVFFNFNKTKTNLKTGRISALSVKILSFLTIEF